MIRYPRMMAASLVIGAMLFLGDCVGVVEIWKE